MWDRLLVDCRIATLVPAPGNPLGVIENGAIGIGYSFGGVPQFPGQRFVARASADPLGLLTFQEAVLATGQASQTDTLRWQDYSTTVIDPSDDQTFWYVGNYLKTGSARPATRIGSYRVP